MKRLWKASAIALLAVLMLAPVASAQRHRVIVRGGFGWGSGWYSPYYGGYWGPGYGYRPYYAAPATGEVKLKTEVKDAEVFVDGGYAGRADKLKKFTLQPGAHDIELRYPGGRSFYSERVHVIAGKTVKIDSGYRD